GVDRERLPVILQEIPPDDDTRKEGGESGVLVVAVVDPLRDLLHAPELRAAEQIRSIGDVEVAVRPLEDQPHLAGHAIRLLPCQCHWCRPPSSGSNAESAEPPRVGLLQGVILLSTTQWRPPKAS